MNFAASDLTSDGFFGSRLKISQPKHGYRAATDPVYLAAAAPALAGQTVLELGCGAGVALCCLNARVADLHVFGVEVQKNYADLARQNLSNNQFEGQIFDGDITDMPDAISQIDFDHVIANPPFFTTNSHTAPSDVGRSTAHIATPNTTAIWVDIALKRLKPKGCLTMIHRVEALPEILTAIGDKAGNIRILPIASRQNRSAGRVLVQAQKTLRGALKLCPAFVVHSGDSHGSPDDGFSDTARAVLRSGEALTLC